LRDTPPDYDSRLYRLIATETVDADANEIRITYSTEARPTEERIESAENEEASRLNAFVRLEREAIETRLMVGAILAYIVDNQLFPAKVRTAADNYIAKAQKVWQNRDRLQEIIDDINNGIEPDLDSGWVDQ